MKTPTPEAMRAAELVFGQFCSVPVMPSKDRIPTLAEIIDREMGGWRPIEEAPKDREIWAFNGEQQRMKWIDFPEAKLWVHSEECVNDVDPMPIQPTHFRELPTPPNQTK